MNKINLRIKQLWIILKYLFIKILNVFTSNKKYNDIWLIAERGDEARDNGYAFYKYMKENHPEKKFYYIIKKDSPDINKIDPSRRIYYQSAKHLKYYMNAKYLLSTHILGFSPEFRSFGKLVKKFKIFDCKGKKVFLQHGITQSYIEYLTKNSVDLDLFICGAKPEYDFILKNFGFDESVVKYTGFARYDYLKSRKKDNYKEILFMPTWRKELFYLTDSEFVQTNYYKNITSILNNEKLNNILNEKNIKLIFYPHYEIQKRIKLFDIKKENVIVASSNQYDISDLLKETDMLITDYSSVFFDIAYQYKPICYFQPDYKEFRKNQYGEGYFDFNNLGFGKVSINVDDLITNVLEIINNDFVMDKEYQEKVNRFFIYNDSSNCDRIYSEIIKK